MSGRPQAQTLLAEQMTQLVHGDEALQQVRRISAALFSGEAQALNEAEFRQLELDGVPATSVTDNQTITDALVSTGLAGSRRLAREFIAAGAIQVNGMQISDSEYQLDMSCALHQRYQLLRRGKKNFHLLCI